MNVIKQCKYGLTMFNSNDMYVGRSLDKYGEYAEGEIDLFKELIKEGDTVYDVGANIGSHTLAFAEIVGKEGTVVAFEPQRQVYYVLCANVALNNISHIHCIPCAVSNIAGSIRVPELNFKEQGNFGALELQESFPDSMDFSIAQVMVIDDLNPVSCDFLKIDVEGMESRVLVGAKKTIETYKPFLYVEDDRQKKSKDLVRMIQELGYETYLHSPNLFTEDNYFGNKQNVFGGCMAVNLFCHHKDVKVNIDFKKLGLSKIELGKDNDFFEKHAAPSKEKNLEQAQHLAANELTHLAKTYSETMFDFDKGMDCLLKAAEMSPRGVAYGNICNLYTKHMRFEEALPYAQRAVELDPENPDAYINLGICHAGLKDYKTSVAIYEEVLKDYPESLRAKFHRGYDKIIQRDFSGWKDYETRFELFNIAKICKERYGDVPIWDGQELTPDDRLLLFVEQGSGDMFQLARYLPMIKEKKGNPHIILELWSGMENIMARCSGMDEIFILSRQDALPEETPRFDYVCSLFSIPHLFNMKSEEDFPLDVPYIFPVHTKRVKDNAEEIKEVLTTDRKMRVGIVWSGNSLHKNDRIRSCHKRDLKPLDDIKDIQLYSLNMSESKRMWTDVGEVDLLEGAEDMDVIDLSKYITDWNDTGHIVDELDLIVSVDTGVAHLAGAMDKIIFLAIPFINDWRWYVDGDTSMWYPTMRIFRQEKPYEWGPVFENIAESIKGLISKYDQ